MKYNVAIIDCTGLEEWQRDVLSQALADIGFDSFEQDGDTLRAYVPSDQNSEVRCQKSEVRSQISEIRSQISDFREMAEVIAENGARLLSFEACADENWNAVWESEHEVEELPMGVRIVPHCAFGAGHHETTAMMINRLIGLADERISGAPNPLTTNPLTVLDMGTGTGVLGIMAAKLEAKNVVAVDIDENSVKNARENAEANGVTIDVRLGSNVPEGAYSLIMANIHRNILLAQMADYARTLIHGGELWLSGFYEADCPTLIAAAAAQGLQHTGTRENGEWRMLTFSKR